MIQTGTPILRDVELLELARLNGGLLTAATITNATGMSQSNANYRLRVMRQRGLLDAFGNITAPAPAMPAQHQQQAAFPFIQAAQPAPAAPAPVYAHAPAMVTTAPAGRVMPPVRLEDLSDAPDLSALIPAERPDYIRRSVDAHIEALAARRENIYLHGEASAGKTTAAEQLAARLSVPFHRIACDDAAIMRDNIGRRELVDGQTIFKAGLALHLFKAPSVILFDELNACPPARLFFMHELLDNRRFFVRDSGAGEIIDLHPDCVIMLASNPAGARYAGTNKMNAALIDRCSVIDVPSWNIDQARHLFDCGAPELTDRLIKFYTDARDMISRQSLRTVFTLRAVKRIASAMRAGDAVGAALAHGFYNAALLTTGQEERDAFDQLARVVFGNIQNNNQQAAADFRKV